MNVERDVSWMYFNHRILQEAEKSEVPLLERLSFLGIYSNNLDEFFRVRVATLNRLADSEALPEKHHKALKKTLKTINQLNEAYAAEYAQVIDTVFEHLEQHHIRVLNETQLNDEQKQFLRRFFYDKLNGSTNPIWLSAIDDLNVFEDNRIYLVVRKTHIEGDGKVKYAIIKVPDRIYGRFIKIPPSDGFDNIMYLDDVIRFCLPLIFIGTKPSAYDAYSFKFTKDAEMEVDNEADYGAMEKIAHGVNSRKRGVPIRVIYDREMPREIRKRISDRLNMRELDTSLARDRSQNHRDLMSFPDCGHAGLRYEYNRMELISNTKSAVESHESHYYRQGDWFPSLNVTYHLLPEHQLRVSYGRSVNRPEFREVSPSVYYDFDLASDVQGNFDLRNCYVDNLDLRYEWYPSRGEVISLAAFWKHFDSPIEWVYTLSGGTDVIYSYMNAQSANNYGLELDIRKQLDFIGLKDFSWSFNGALIHSRVRFAPGSNVYDRPMQGQSPYLVNTGIFYYNEPLQLSVNLLYNRIGKRIVGVGRTTGGGDASRNIRVPDSYEMPRDVFDLTASKRFGPLEIKLAIRDLLNQQITFKQFSDVMVQGEGRRIEQVTRCYRPGMNLNFSATLTL